MMRWITLSIICIISIYTFYIVQYEVYHTNYFGPLWPTFFEEYIMLPFIQIVLQIIWIGFVLLIFKGIRRLFKYERGLYTETFAILFVVGAALYLSIHLYLQTYDLYSMLAMTLVFIFLSCNSMVLQLMKQKESST